MTLQPQLARAIGRWSLVCGYYIAGVRHVTAMVAGASGLEYPIFAVFAYCGATTWVLTFLSLGYFLGDRWQDRGTEIVPEEVCGSIDLASDTEDDPIADKLLEYCEGNQIESVERKQGWYARLSAPGYLDCTSWDGPYATSKEALDAVKEFYECDDNGDSSDDSEDDAGETVRP